MYIPQPTRRDKTALFRIIVVVAPLFPLACPLAKSGAVPQMSLPAGGVAVNIRPILAILDPVDIAAEKSVPPYGDELRTQAVAAGRFAPIPRIQMEKKMAEFNWDATTPCHEFQCAFDAANLLLSEYVLFGTVTPLDGIYAYTFNLLHIPTGQVVLSQAGDVARSPGAGGDLPLKAKLAAFISGIDPMHLDLAQKTSLGLMAVIDLSPETPESRVLSERVAAHVHASRHYDLMGSKELQELMIAMEIPIGAIATTDSGMIGLGTRLNVAYLVHSKLSEDPQGMRLDLALFDIAGKRRIRDWPSHSQRGFQDILHVENRFFHDSDRNQGTCRRPGAETGRAGFTLEAGGVFRRGDFRGGGHGGDGHEPPSGGG